MTAKQVSPSIRVAFLRVFSIIARAVIFKAYTPYQE
jgi:hypothetical protein